MVDIKRCQTLDLNTPYSLNLIYQVSDKKPLQKYGDVESYLAGTGNISYLPQGLHIGEV